jgi:UDP-GlcNAc:undecaprenyl-phosphate/decaprenyl-phosphate GlcNAc-1-phosphate transferase
MSALVAAVLAGVAACAVALLLTPWMAATATRIGLVDRPDGALKRQREPVPYLGGLAVFVAFLAAFAAFGRFDQQALAILLGATLVMALGLLDDMGRLSPWAKLAGQSLAVLTAVKAGVGIHIALFPDWLSFALTFFWLLLMTNAMNLIDIMDGLSSGVGAIACFFLLVVALSAGQGGEAVMAAALMGALAGFLRHNRYPARIYLGDAGSLFAGFVLGALALTGVWARENELSLLAPLLVLGVPLFDTVFVSVIRISRGASPLRGSPDHFPLRLRRWRLSVPRTVLASYAASALLGAAALGMVFSDAATASALLAGVSLLLLLAAFWLRGVGADL